MSAALWVAKTGLDAQQTRLEVISNNLSNVNTTGYKYSRPVFEDLLYQNVHLTTANKNNGLPSGFMLGTGVRTVATEKIHSQGNLIKTANPFDVAINGRGFFQVLKPDGTIGYTRDGSFQINSQGQLVTSGGLLLQPAITIPKNSSSVHIGTDGVVSATVPGRPGTVKVGYIQTADFINPSGLQPIGENLFAENAASGRAQAGTPGVNGLGPVLQGELESSNVNVVKEMVDMIEAQRAYEVNSKAISTADQMLQYLNNTV
jgi:flagellar basal-body rod protein FlgG